VYALLVVVSRWILKLFFSLVADMDLLARRDVWKSGAM
jgi:hypothetical protein